MTNVLLFVLIGIAIVLLGIAGELFPQEVARGARLIAAVLGLVVVIAVLLR